MEIHSIGYHHAHDSSFIIDRPNGIGNSWLFLLFKSAAVVRQDGMDIVIQPNSFIMYTGNRPQYYRAYGEEYIDDWFHFTVEPLDLVLFRELEIPLNKAVYLGNISEISGLIRTMTHEHYAGNMYNADMVGLYMKILFFKLSRQLHSEIRPLPKRFSSKHDTMILLRSRIYSNICSVGSVSEIADELNMSVSAFQHTYKRIFGVNVMSDIVKSRLEHAKRLLSTTDLPLRIIAEQSGYSSEFHLMRQFKELMKMTPTDYRKNQTQGTS